MGTGKYEGETFPAWVKTNALFALDGKVYRVFCDLPGSTNRGPQYPDSRDCISAVLLGDHVPALPPEGSTKGEVLKQLHSIFELPRFYADDLARALHLAEPPGAPGGESDDRGILACLNERGSR